jgi:predicted phosphate transport protein (TIGR00153 family)
MRGDSIVKWFMPKEERFHELLAKDTQNLVKASQLFAEVAASTKLDERRSKKDQLKAIEHEGDLITREIFEALNSTFITPLDREDIAMIAGNLDDILDYMESVAHNLVLFELHDSPEPLRQFARILGILVEQIDTVTKEIWDLSNAKAINAHIIRISELENEADTLYSTVIADLFKSGKNPIEILKWKEVYDGLENACDECRDYTHAIGNIVVKNA